MSFKYDFSPVSKVWMLYFKMKIVKTKLKIYNVIISNILRAVHELTKAVAVLVLCWFRAGETGFIHTVQDGIYKCQS